MEKKIAFGNPQAYQADNGGHLLYRDAGGHVQLFYRGVDEWRLANLNAEASFRFYLDFATSERLDIDRHPTHERSGQGMRIPDAIWFLKNVVRAY